MDRIAKNILASFLVDPDAKHYISVLETTDFPVKLQEIFNVMKNLYVEKKPIDLLTVVEKIPHKEKAIYELIETFESSVYIEAHVQSLRENRQKKHIKILAQKLMQQIEKTDAAKALGEFISNVRANDLNDGVLTFKQVGRLWVEEFEQRLKTDYEVILKTGFNRLDKICFFKKGELIVLAARPSIGKSCFAANIADYISMNDKANLIVSLEMTGQQIFERVATRYSQVAYTNIQSPKGLRPEAYAAITRAVQKIKDRKIYILHKSYLDIDKIIFECENIKAQRKVDFLIIDYLQLIQASLKYGSTNDKINDMTKKLKALALSLNIPILLLCQLNREIEKREDRTPKLSDLRDSGGIEQDADKVIFLDRDLKSESDRTRLSIAKDRTGPRGELELRFNGNFQTFYEI